MNKNIKSKYKILKALTAATLLFSHLTSATSMQEIEKEGVLTIVTEDNYAPFNFMNKGNPDGFNNDILIELKAYAKDKFTIEQTIMPWTGLLASVTSGRYSLAITGSVATEERIKKLDFSIPLASSQNLFVKKSDDKSISTIASLDGKTLGVQSGTVFYNNLHQLQTMLDKTGGKLGTIIQYQSYPEAYADLANGRLDYVVNSEMNINDLVEKRSKIFAKGLAVSTKSYYAWPLTKGNDQLLDYIDGFILKLKESGQLAQLQQKWFGQTYDDLPDFPIKDKATFMALPE